MSDKDLHEKRGYFKAQDLLDQSDDETDFPDESFFRVGRALADSKAMPPPELVRQRNTFLGLTPKEQHAEFNARAITYPPVAQSDRIIPSRPMTAPEPEATTFSVTASESRSTSTSPKNRIKRKRKQPRSMPEPKVQDRTPFYKRMGVVPRELKSGKSVPSADNINLEPEHKQLLRGKIVYFYPPDDISLARRRRIHKLIQLGAAWITAWRNDVTHIMVDDGNYTYSRLLDQFTLTRFPHHVVVVKFDPYIPQCIQFGKLLDPTAARFTVKGALSSEVVEPPPPPPVSQMSLHIKPSGQRVALESPPMTDPVSTEDHAPQQPADEAVSTGSDVVKDSFICLPNSSPDQMVSVTHIDGDALSEAIKETKAIAHLPINEEEDDADSRPSSSSGKFCEPETDDEDASHTAKRPKLSKFTYAVPKRKGGINQHRFQCMDPVGASSENPNARTIQVLEQMGKYYDQMQDQWRTLGYRKAVTTLRKQTTQITTAEEAAALPFIGPRLAEKIEEIVLTDRLRRLDSTRDDPTDQVLRLFLGVYGAGLAQANKWIQAGYRTLEDLRLKAKLTEPQKIGLEHYGDFASRIPRAEVEAHGNVVKKALYEIDPGFQATIMGSYRRGAKDSGDIDIIITKPGTPLSLLHEFVFQDLIPTLFKQGFIKAKLAASSRGDTDGSKWHGASCLPSSTTWRRLDLLLVPEEEMGAALLYFTGNDIFNRSMRLLASKKGMRLNQHGLYSGVIRGKNREKLNEGTLVEGRDEKRIFEILGVPWREPTERIC